MQSDEELIQELHKGIESSMEVLIKRHYSIVFSYIYRQTGDYHTSYDLTQETFIKMVRSIGTVTQGQSFKLWLLKIALNTCRDYFKSKSFKTVQASSEWKEEYEDRRLIDYFDKKLESAAVQAAIMELPDYQRETIILRYYQDLKIKDIAHVTAVGEPTVKSRIKQGLSKLKQLMERRSLYEQKQPK